MSGPSLIRSVDGIEVIDFEGPSLLGRPKTYEAVFDAFKAICKAHPEAPAAACAIMVADELGVSVQHVVEACATVHAANAARGKFERNE